MIVSFLSGATMLGCLAIGLFFVRFWKATNDRFFIYFAVCFGLLALERIAILMLPLPNEARPLTYLIRLFAFIVIIVAFIDKNWNTR